MSRKIKRIMSQLVETEHWYRWRKFGDDRAVSVLNDTWNGSNTLLNWQIMKVEHMMYNLHKYGNESSLYVNSFDVIKYGDQLTKDYVIDMITRHLLASPGERKYVDESYFVSFDPGCSSWKLWKRELDHTIPYRKISKKDRLYEMKTDSEGSIGFHPIDKNVYRFVEDSSWERLSEVAAYLKTKNVDLYEKLIENEQSVNFELKDINHLCSEVKSRVRGNIPKYRQLWKYRKLIRKLQIDFDWDEPWLSKVFKILKIEDADVRKAEIEKVFKDFKDWRMSILIEIAELWNEYSDNWWD